MDEELVWDMKLFLALLDLDFKQTSSLYFMKSDLWCKKNPNNYKH